jgi:hypothetical protein
MKTRPIAAALLLAFLSPAIGATANPAYAQQADDPSTKAARARFQEGVAAFDKGEYEHARAAFLQAYALRKHPSVLLNLAQSSLRSGHFLEAAKYFQSLRDSQNLSSAQRADAERGMNEARQKIGRIEISAPAGANVTVDGEGVGTAPLSEAIDVEPGSHKVKAGTEEVTVNVQAGQKGHAKLTQGSSGGVAVAPLPPPPPPLAAPLPPPPAPPIATEPSSNAVLGSASSPAQDAGPSGEKTSIFAPPATMVPVYVGGGVALAGFATALVIGVIAKASAQNAADSVAAAIRAHASSDQSSVSCSAPPPAYRSACATLIDDNSKVDTDAAIGNVGLAVGIVGTVFAAGWYLFAPKKSATKAEAATETATWHAPLVTPMLGTRSNGLAISGTF